MPREFLYKCVRGALFPAAAVPVVGAVAWALVSFLTRATFAVHSPELGGGAVIITGASSGIGRHAAEHLARLGLVVFAGVRSAADEAALEQVGLGDRLRPLRLDVTDAASMAAAVERVRDECARDGLPLAALVNNAGVGTGLPLELERMERARSLFEVNFFGVVHLTQLCLPLLRASQGRVIFVSSVSGLIALPGRALYSASKFAIEGLADSLRNELGSLGVSVSVVEPAYVQSSIVTNGLKGRESASFPADVAKAYERFLIPELREAHLQQNARGSSPAVTSAAIADAILSAHPQTRYPVAQARGIDARILVWLARLPDRVRDFLVAKMA